MEIAIEIKGIKRAVNQWPLVTGYWDQARVAWSDHQRARNWTATVVCDKGQPGGLARCFWARGSGSYVKPACEVGDYLEVASDYYSCGGHKQAHRHYFRVLAIGDEEIIVREAGTPPAKPPAVSREIGVAGLDEMSADPNPLVDFSDADLLAEIRRRGLGDEVLRAELFPAVQ